jgi:CheY-like chemotaxis protein
MKKIIIPEDIKAVLEKAECFLTRSDIRIFTTTNNEEALALHRTEKADLIIAKLDTPKMSGERFTSLIRDDKELRKVSIIILSSGGELDAERSLRCRANAFLACPVNHDILLQEVHQLLHIGHRKSCRVPVSIKIQGRSSEIPFTGYAENLSVSGMLLHSDTLLYEGDAITCAFYLPDSTHITTNAEVIRTLERETEHDTNGYGIKFIDLSTDFSSAIEGFVKKEQQNV